MARLEIRSEVTGKVWQIEACVGARVDADASLVIIESMKMEIPVACDQAATVVELCVAEGDLVQEGQVIVIVET